MIAKLTEAEAGQLVYLVGGDAAALKQAEPVLNAMGSAIHHVGPLGSLVEVKNKNWSFGQGRSRVRGLRWRAL